ncbi:MAG: MFS transporter [Candidatus Binataceae bacterium]
MTKQERRAWLIVASLFVTNLAVFGGGYNTTGVFFPPLLKQFGWSRTQISALPAALAAAAGLSVPLAGWLLDRVEARVVMVAGAAMAGLAFIAASRVNSFPPLVAAYVVLGVGITGSTLLPVSLVIANWFGTRRGLAMGVAMTGTSLGGAAMTIVASFAIGHAGWRAAYLTLGLPMVVVVIPVLILMVRTRPPSVEKLSVSAQASSLPGLEVGPALRSRSFWMVAAAQFLYAATASGIVAHLISYLVGIGYKPALAAAIMGTTFLFTSAGKLVMGLFADRLSGRIALTLNFAIAALGTLMLLGGTHPAVLLPTVLVMGLTLGAPLVLVPLVMVESVGLKRFGSLSGLTGLFNTIGGAVGPIAAGRIFDVSGSYANAFELFAVMLLLGGIATYACLPLEAEQQRAARPLATSA